MDTFPAQISSACACFPIRRMSFSWARRALLPSLAALSLGLAAGPRAHSQAAPAPSANQPATSATESPATAVAPVKVPDPGSVSGTVVDEKGNPVEGATVQFYDGFGMPIRLRSVHTDHSGHFVAYSLHPGEWALYPSKVEDGYADQLYGSGISPSYRAPRATIQSNTETSGVVLHLPPKAATVHIEVMDADTNQPLRSMEVDVQSMQPGRQMPSSGDGWVHNRRPAPADLLIAPGIVRLTVSSLGYEKWMASEDTGRRFLALRSGEHRVLMVKLHAANLGVRRSVRPYTPQTGSPQAAPQTPAVSSPNVQAPTPPAHP